MELIALANPSRFLALAERLLPWLPAAFRWTSTGLDHQPYGGRAVGLPWQQGPLSPGAIGRFLVPEPLSKRLLYVEPLRQRMRMRFGGIWIAESERVLLLFEPGRYPVAYFP